MYTDFEQDLILACKCHYGENGIEKVISDYVGYTEEHEVTIDSKYHFISELYVKMVENRHLKLSILLQNKLSPGNIYDIKNKGYVSYYENYSIRDVSRIICHQMISEIQGVRVRDGDKVLIELHECNEKFKDKDKEEN